MPPKKTLEAGMEAANGGVEATMDPRDRKIADLQKTVDGLVDAVAAAGSVKTEAKRVYERVGRFMVIGDEMVVGFGQATQADKTGRNLTIPLTLMNREGVERVETVDYMGMMQEQPRYLADIVKTDRQEEVVHQGPIPVQHRTSSPDPMGMREGKTKFESRVITLEHTKVSTKVTIKFLEGPWLGEERTVDVGCMNP